MNAVTTSMAARALVARSRRPARANFGAAAHQLTAEPSFAPRPDNAIPVVASVAPAAATPTKPLATSVPSPAAPPRLPASWYASARPPRPGTSRFSRAASGPTARMPGTPARVAASPSVTEGDHRLPSPVAAASPGAAPPPTASPPQPTPATPAPGTNPLAERAHRSAPRVTAATPGANAPPAAPAPQPMPATPEPGTDPLAERAHRPAPPAVGPGPVTMAPTALQERHPTAPATPVPERASTVPEPGGSRAETAQPPVTIGEIHVHVVEPPSAAADPLVLLTPYAQGLTATRGGTG
jgi:hypothetical protein